MILTLSSESVHRTTFTDERGLPMYTSATPFHLTTSTTTITRHAWNCPEVEAGRIDWHTFRSSIFTIGGMQLESNVFLPKHGFFGKRRTFTGPDNRHYRWDTHHGDFVLSLDESGTEIARYQRGTLGIIGKRRHACLEIAPQAMHMLDLIILTFIYVEKLRLDEEEDSCREGITILAGGA